MPKQTLEFIKNIAILGLTHGCVHNIMGHEKNGLENDKAYIESLIRTGQTIRSDLKKKSELFKKLSKAKTAEGKPLNIFNC
jgi:hypothetical protein